MSQSIYPSQAVNDIGIGRMPAGIESFRFPENLETEIEHWVVFRVQKHVLMARDDFDKVHDIARIYLPVPASLGTQYGQEYNTEGIGLMGAMGAEHGGAILDAFDESPAAGLTSIVEKLVSIATGAGSQGIVRLGTYYGTEFAQGQGPALAGAAIGDALARAAPPALQGLATGAGAAIGAGASQFIKGALAGHGVALNPYMAVMYSKPQMRTHSFSWKLIPRSRAESRILRDIIRVFKYHSSPNVDPESPDFFRYPEQFDIDFRYPDYLYNVGPSVLTSLDVAYHSEGMPLYFDIEDDDGPTKAPVAVTITAQFQEVSIITKNEIVSQNR